MFCPAFARIPSSLQELAPSQARFCLAVARFLTHDLNIRLHGTSLLVGFSGGADSTALLLTLHCLAPSFKLTIVAAHLDHGLRPSSAQEAEHCRAFCRAMGILCVTERHSIADQGQGDTTGFEEKGRIARYDFFARTAEHIGSEWILTGHQNNDLAEDLLMRLIRGAGWPALSGMPAVDRRRRLLRPLLLTPRLEIERFLLSLGLDWLRDESNTDLSYLRNRVRMELLPLILRENPAFLTNAAGLWRLGLIDEEYFTALLPSPEHFTYTATSSAGQDGSKIPPHISPDRPHTLIHESPATLVTRADQLTALPKALRLRLYKRLLTRLGPGQALLPSLLRLDRAWLSGKRRTTHDFPGGKSAVVDSKGILWIKRSA